MSTALVPLYDAPRPATDLDRLKRLVLSRLTSNHSRRAYAQALNEFLGWYEAERPGAFSKLVVQEYRTRLEGRGLAPSTINIHLTAIRRLATEAAEAGWLASDVAAGIAGIRGARKLGERTGQWLGREQTRALLDAPDPQTLKGKRDRAVLALLAGCGLRRSEIAGLNVSQIQQREARWVLADLTGKGRRIRTVPVPAWTKVRLDEWTTAARIAEGRLIRAINKSGRLHGAGVTEKVIWWIVRDYAGTTGVPQLAPHDLRRTCAKLCRASGGELEQIQLLLGHASIQTTEKYLGTRQNLADAVNDRLGLGL